MADRIIVPAEVAGLDIIASASGGKEQLEREQAEARVARNAETPGRYKHAQASFFQTRDRTEDVDGNTRKMGIRDVVNWARTDKGGRQFQILQPAPSGGCMRWGICEAPRPEGGGR